MQAAAKALPLFTNNLISNGPGQHRNSEEMTYFAVRKFGKFPHPP